jgi:hypothetical protein
MKRKLTIAVFLIFILSTGTASWGLDAIVEKPSV